ncbi:MAG: hypothetical protein ACT6QS_01965 [Flavobacteriales bacterium]
MSDQNRLYLGIGIALLYVTVISAIFTPLINHRTTDSYFPLILLGVILFVLSSGILLAYTWKGIDLKKQKNRRWLIVFLIIALYIALFNVPSLILLAPAPLILPFLGFWFARRFFEW